MAIYNWNAIYLGNAADIDTDEASIATETPGSLLGTFGSSGAPLADNIVDVVVDDADGDTNINTDNDAFDDPEPMLIDGVSHVLDSGAVYNATITYTDGTTATITAVILQTTDGNLYLAPEMSDNADKAAMEAKAIESLTLDSVAVGTTNIGANRQQTNFVCFVLGTLIDTPHGPTPVERLAPGDAVLTLDHGAQPICRVWSGLVSVTRQIVSRGAAPVIIPAHVFGASRPLRPLRVSPQHRLLLNSPVARRMFGSDDVLIAAKRLVGIDGIGTSAVTGPVRYFHFALARHEIVFAEGLPAESLYLGREARRVIGPEALDARDICGDAGMREEEAQVAEIPVRPIAEGHRARRLLGRMCERAHRAGASRVFHGMAISRLPERQISPAW